MSMPSQVSSLVCTPALKPDHKPPDIASGSARSKPCKRRRWPSCSAANLWRQCCDGTSRVRRGRRSVVSGFLSMTWPSTVMGKSYQRSLGESRKALQQLWKFVLFSFRVGLLGPLAVVLTATREAEATNLRGIPSVPFFASLSPSLLLSNARLITIIPASDR